MKVVLFYNGFDVPTRQILDLRGAIPSKTAADANNSNLIKEIRASTNAALRNQGALIKTLEIQIGQRGFGRFYLEPRLKLTQETMSSRSQLLLKLIQARYSVWDPPNTPYPLDRTVH
ncbi:hypothetical protein Tco_0008400 [Tanacetum coccineum]